MNELKPCPFCGGEADYYLGDGGYVQCSHCLATIPYRYELPYGEGKKQAITAWNRRSDPENKPLTLEQLRQMDGEPVWVCGLSGHEIKWTPGWRIVDGNYVAFRRWNDTLRLYFADYGRTWLAYARKPEA